MCKKSRGVTQYRKNGLRTLQWRHNGHDRVSNHQPHDCLLNRLFRHRKKTSKLRFTGLYVGNSPGTGEFPAPMTSNAENVSIWWRHHDILVGEFNGKCHHRHVSATVYEMLGNSIVHPTPQKSTARSRPFGRGLPRWLVDFLHKEVMMPKRFPCYDVILYWN